MFGLLVFEHYANASIIVPSIYWNMEQENEHFETTESLKSKRKKGVVNYEQYKSTVIKRLELVEVPT